MLLMRGLHIEGLHINLLLLKQRCEMYIFDDMQWDALYLCLHCVAACDGGGQASLVG